MPARAAGTPGVDRWIEVVDPTGAHILRAIRLGRGAGRVLAGLAAPVLAFAAAGAFVARRSP